jgi:predicted PurR-regulated permease PerM
MNESHTHTELSDQIATLRRQTFTLLLALIIVSGTLVVYLFYQSRIVSQSIETYRPQAMQTIQNYNQNIPAIQSIVKQLVAYGQAHPEFQQQVLKKYGITPQTIAELKK